VIDGKERQEYWMYIDAPHAALAIGIAFGRFVAAEAFKVDVSGTQGRVETRESNRALSTDARF